MKSLRMPIVLLLTTSCVILSSFGDNLSSLLCHCCHCRSAQRRLSGRRSRARRQSGTRESASSVPSVGPRNSNDRCIGNKKLHLGHIHVFQYFNTSNIQQSLLVNLCLHFPCLSFRRQKLLLLQQIHYILTLIPDATYPGGPTCGHLPSALAQITQAHPGFREQSVHVS